jgi:predicted dehydrogenase
MSRSSRRKFLTQSAALAAGVGVWAAGGLPRAESKAPIEQVNIACIGVGGKGDSDTKQASKVGNVVALCDIDDNTLDKMAESFAKDGKTPKKYNDYRKMLEEMDKQIDAVTVSTPDHHHAPASVMAMKMGKHVYCQKPLTHTVQEARTMREVARDKKVVTQMGNQGTASNGLRRGVELIRGGIIGKVHEVHVWTNRPIWPQGSEAILKVGPARAAALAALYGKTAEVAKVTPPAHVHWDLFLGPAKERAYDPIYHPFSWRGWLDYGTGALGDMACHTANLAFMALKLGHPTSVVAEAGDVNPETFPMWAKIVFTFPAREDMPEVKFTWYEGSKKQGRVLPPANLIKGKEFSDSGSLLVGDKGTLFSPNDYGESYEFLGDGNFKEAEKMISESLPRNGHGDDGMKEEWVKGIKGGPAPLSNFDYAAMLTETILLGNVAVRAGGKIEWDGPNLKITNNKDANNLLHYEYRTGWKL